MSKNKQLELATIKKSYFIFAIIGLVALIVLGKYFFGQKKYVTGEVAPDFELVLENKEVLNLSNMKGKYFLLDFWGSWCVPCRADNLKLVKVYDEFHGRKFEKATDFEIISVSIEKDISKWKKAIQEDQMNWKYHYSDLNMMDSDIAKTYRVQQVPTKYLINEKGIIVGVDQTVEEIAAFLEKRVVKN